MRKSARASLHPNQIQLATAVLEALAHPLRLRIIRLLHQKAPASVQVVYTELGIEQSVASQQLRILREANLVYTQRKGKYMHYLLNLDLLERSAELSSALFHSEEESQAQ